MLQLAEVKKLHRLGLISDNTRSSEMLTVRDLIKFITKCNSESGNHGANLELLLRYQLYYMAQRAKTFALPIIIRQIKPSNHEGI